LAYCQKTNLNNYKQIVKALRKRQDRAGGYQVGGEESEKREIIIYELSLAKTKQNLFFFF